MNHDEVLLAYRVGLYVLDRFKLGHDDDCVSDVGLWAIEIVQHADYPASFPEHNRARYVCTAMRNRIINKLKHRKHEMTVTDFAARKPKLRNARHSHAEAALFRNEVTPLDVLVDAEERERHAALAAKLRPGNFSRKDWLVQRARRKRLLKERAERAES